MINSAGVLIMFSVAVAVMSAILIREIMALYLRNVSTWQPAGNKAVGGIIKRRRLPSKPNIICSLPMHDIERREEQLY